MRNNAFSYETEQMPHLYNVGTQKNCASPSVDRNELTRSLFKDRLSLCCYHSPAPCMAQHDNEDIIKRSEHRTSTWQSLCK